MSAIVAHSSSPETSDDAIWTSLRRARRAASQRWVSSPVLALLEARDARSAAFAENAPSGWEPQATCLIEAEPALPDQEGPPIRLTD